MRQHHTHRELSTNMLFPVFVLAVCALPVQSFGQEAIDCQVIERRIPPAGKPATAEQLENWQPRLDRLEAICQQHSDHSTVNDIAVIAKAVRFAILHHEFYSKKDPAKVERLLKVAEERAKQLAYRQTPWETASGKVIRGFRSAIDDSPQPIGLELPEGWSTANKDLPLIVWLHGRGDKVTDLHFLHQRLDSGSSVSTDAAIVLHPFGRQCVGYKSAGETDVMEAIDFVCEKYPIDRDRIVLMGFSMGGAGVWHLAAHYTDRFIAASPGAGFAETAQYNRLTPEKYPPKYEQILWSIYDVPGYTRNLFNIPVIAYSGENDKQIQAARVMEAAFAKYDRELPHLIGPGMGHKYHPDTLAELNGKIAAYIDSGRQAPDELYLQTRHLRYATRKWITIDGMIKPFEDTRVHAKRVGPSWQLTTSNVSRLVLDLAQIENYRLGKVISIDGHDFDISTHRGELQLSFDGHAWQTTSHWGVRKHPGMSGPIDDAFLDRFLVVLPSKAGDSAVDRWAHCEAKNLERRWQELFRGSVRIKKDVDVTEQDMRDNHLVVWGTPRSNVVLGRAMQMAGNDWPIKWNDQSVAIGPRSAAAESHALIGIHPNPAQPDKYLVINSGPTFRQDHDRTNSLQNPKLGDWAIIGLDEPPSGSAPGRIAATGFFDDRWRYDENMSW